MDGTQLKEFKENKYRIGILNKDVYYIQKYEKGSMVMWKRNKSWYEGKWDGTFNIYCIIKCQKGLPYYQTSEKDNGFDWDRCRAFCSVGKSYSHQRFMAYVAECFGTTVKEMKLQWRNVK